MAICDFTLLQGGKTNGGTAANTVPTSDNDFIILILIIIILMIGFK